MTFRIGNIDDIPAIDKLNRKRLPENYPMQFWAMLIAASQSSCFVYEDENKEIIAYIVGAVEYNSKKQLNGHIYSIAVDEAHVRKGYATTLLSAFEQDLRNRFSIVSIVLHVRKSNEVAISLYNKNGYFREKKVKGYYKSPGNSEDAYLMRKKCN